MTCNRIISAFHSFLNAAAKNPVRPRKNTAEFPPHLFESEDSSESERPPSAVFLQKIEASPAALLIRAEQHKKVFFSF